MVEHLMVFDHAGFFVALATDDHEDQKRTVCLPMAYPWTLEWELIDRTIMRKEHNDVSPYEEEFGIGRGGWVWTL